MFRFGLIPMFIFSGTFFPIERLPEGLESSPGQRRCGTPWSSHAASRPESSTARSSPSTSAYLVVFTAVGAAIAVRACETRLRR